MAKTKDKVLSVEALRPYVKRAMDDPELRDDLMAAFVAARKIYGDMARSPGVRSKAEKVSEKRFQKQLQELMEELGDATERLKGETKTKSHKARNRVILLTGVTLGVLYNPWTGASTREWIMDRIAGGNGNGYQEFGEDFAADAKGAVDEAKSTAADATT